jgi:hypothetical protein
MFHREEGTMITAVLLLKTRYLWALRSAEAKDRTINYRVMKADRSICLLYNPLTGDGKFSSRLNARGELANGYYLAYPWMNFSETLVENNEYLHANGWPDYESEGV